MEGKISQQVARHIRAAFVSWTCSGTNYWRIGSSVPPLLVDVVVLLLGDAIRRETYVSRHKDAQEVRAASRRKAIGVKVLAYKNCVRRPSSFIVQLSGSSRQSAYCLSVYTAYLGNSRTIRDSTVIHNLFPESRLCLYRFMCGWSFQRKPMQIIVVVPTITFMLGNFVASQAIVAYRLRKSGEVSASANVAELCCVVCSCFHYYNACAGHVKRRRCDWGNSKSTFAVIALVLLVYLVPLLGGFKIEISQARGLQPARCKTVLPDSYGVAVLMRARFRDPENG
jgi:hypothetical protein